MAIFSTIFVGATVLGLIHETTACVPPPHQAWSSGHTQKRDSGPALEVPTNQDDRKHWTVDENTRQMQVTDDAFNARDISRFNHHPNITVYNPGGVLQNLEEHLSGIQITYSNTELTLHNHDYKIMFGEGDWTVAVETITGVQNGPQNDLSGAYIAPTNKELQYDLMTIARWNNGWMMEEYLWPDQVLSYRQAGILPSPPDNNLPDLELNLATPLSTSNSSNPKANKDAMIKADSAINDGEISIENLQLAPNAEIFGLTDQPLDPQGYVAWLKELRVAFPDLQIDNKPYRQIVGQGDWTATAANITGTHTGPLTLPKYLSEDPIKATEKTFELLHYTIARWQNGKIVGLRVNMDMFGLIAALGIQL